MTLPATWFLALTDSMSRITSPVQEQPLTLLNQVTTTGSAPTDAVPPPTTQNIVGDGATADPKGNWTPILGAIRCDGFRQLSLSLEVFGTSGTLSATFQPYFFDGVRWCACADTIVLTNTQTAAGPAARQRHDIVVENDYGFILVVSAISGTGAKASAWGMLRDVIIGTK